MHGKKRHVKWLEPKNGNPRKFKIATFDVEANNWIDFEMIGFFDGLTYWQFNTVEEFYNHVVSRDYRGFKFFGHYAGKYDTLFLLQHILDKKPETNYRLIMQSAKIISLKIKDENSKASWQFCDSSALFPGLSLEKLTTSFNVDHKKLSGTIDFKTERVNKSDLKHKAYLKNDCVGLYEVLTKYFSMPKVKEDGFSLTIASKAMSMWRRTLKETIQVTDQRVQNFCRKSYVGGRCEIFKMRGAGLAYYDVNSLYPFVMRCSRIPTSYVGRTGSLHDAALGFYDVTIQAPLMYIPILPLKVDGKLLFPTGVFRGVYFSEELKLALEHGYKIIKMHSGHLFNESRDLFSEYIDHWYQVKESSDPTQKLVAKLKLNSLYGKFGQAEEVKILKTDEGESRVNPYHSQELYDKTKLISFNQFERYPHMLVHIASAITSYARIHMFKSVYSVDASSCFYTDTDSILSSKFFTTGANLGELKLEHKDIDGIFKQPKAYYLSKSGQLIDSKVKGFSKDFIKTLDRNTFDKLNFTETIERPASAKRSLISNGNYLSKISITKRIKSDYNKRRILRGGDTEPWVLNKNGIIINQERRRI